jgi:hypothetical protein
VICCNKVYPDYKLYNVCTECKKPLFTKEQFSNQTLINELKQKDKYIEELEGQLESKENKTNNRII